MGGRPHYQESQKGQADNGHHYGRGRAVAPFTALDDSHQQQGHPQSSGRDPDQVETPLGVRVERLGDVARG